MSKAENWNINTHFCFPYHSSNILYDGTQFRSIFLSLFTMKGGCHCGAIKFKTAGDPFWVGACYCIDCRKISGSPYTVFVGYDKKDVDISGTPKEYSSSEKVTRSFCEICSSPLAYVYKTSPDRIFIPAGVFDDPSSFKIEKHILVSQKLPWVFIHDNLPRED